MIHTNRFFYIITSFLILLSSSSMYAQRIDHNQHNEELACRKEKSNLLELTDLTYDVKHYHIDVEISIDTEYISGSVTILADATEDITTISLDLDDAYTILSIDGASSYIFNNNEIEVTLENPVLEGEEFSLKVYYQGVPPLTGGYKGLRYETHNGGEPIIASLSTPYLAQNKLTIMVQRVSL